MSSATTPEATAGTATETATGRRTSARDAQGHSDRLLKKAVHHNRLLSRQGLLERMFTAWFRGFVYNQIWEDPRVDLEALQIDDRSEILTISSGGCNILNYLIAGPRRIVAVDLNRSHMALTRLKLAALKHLPSYEAFFDFFGKADTRQNVERYRQYIRPQLDDDSRRFWEGGSWLRRGLRRRRINYFAKGFYDRSKLGLFLRFAHRAAKLTRRSPERLLQARNLEEQKQLFKEIYEPVFRNKLVKWGSKVPMAVYSLGIPPSQFKAMKDQSNGGLAELYCDRVRRLACGFPLEDNYFTWQAFGRRYDRVNRKALPDYLKPEHYELMRSRLDRVQTYLTSTIHYLKEQPEGALDRFVFLDSQDWMPPEVITEQWTQIARVGRPDSRIIFRTAAADSPIETALPGDLRSRFVYERDLSKALYEKDRSAIYGGFHLYRMPGR